MRQKKDTTKKKDEPKAITFAEFLKNTPPQKIQKVIDLCIIDKSHEDIILGGFTSSMIPLNINTPPIKLYCRHVSCNGNRNYEFVNKEGDIHSNDIRHKFILEYHCRDCRQGLKIYSIFAQSNQVGRHDQGYKVFKIGEWPAFGPHIPKKVIKFIGDDYDLFSKGLKAENQGLGIGAFSYYRRVVENQKNHLFDQIIKVSKKLNAKPDIIQKLKKAQESKQFSYAMEEIKAGMPEILLIDGHSPLKLLHKALSIGIHDKTDDECLELAHDIRKVLTELSERLSQALKDDKDLKKTVGRLSNL
jgi:hypothetical protein